MAFDRILLPGSISRTEKLFHVDAYSTSASARVLFVADEFVVLDRTILYAESGGQACDQGLINDVQVTDVQDQGGRALYVHRTDIDVPVVKVDTIIVHRLAEAADFQVGQEVTLTLNWQRRYRLMKAHSAAHFLFHAIQTIYGSPGAKVFTKGCHISEDGARFDFAANLDSALSPEVEKLANDLIGSGQNIQMIPEPASSEVFYWTVGNIVIPCGGTHVKHTRELSPIRVSRKKKGSGLTRVSMTGETKTPEKVSR